MFLQQNLYFEEKPSWDTHLQKIKIKRKSTFINYREIWPSNKPSLVHNVIKLSSQLFNTLFKAFSRFVKGTTRVREKRSRKKKNYLRCDLGDIMWHCATITYTKRSSWRWQNVNALHLLSCSYIRKLNYLSEGGEMSVTGLWKPSTFIAHLRKMPTYT